ncbi:MAG: hypothetical protein COW65_00540 [Cytophagales bacterium CG18_big_fil_WC_8_21_14_2_50_42_9]|nr:MAG: hypothetical protein COW65_00540 [Cytophagales bacterium CG18_big_fil_WC_8_21_14_2_50_42_9]
MRIMLFLLLLLPGLLQAQDKLEESLKNQLNNAKTDSARVKIICDLSNCYFLTDAKKGREQALIAEKLATKINFLAGKAQALNLVGYSHMMDGEYDQAMKYYYEALELGEQTGEMTIIAQSYLNLGVIHRKLNDPARAIQRYQHSLQYAVKAKDTLVISRVYNNLGNVYEDKGLYEKALELFKKAAKLQEKTNDKRMWGISLHNIGNVYTLLPQPEKGLPYLFKAISINNEIHNEISKITNFASVATLYELMGENEEALKYAELSYDIAIKTGASKWIAVSAKLLHKLYATRKDYEQAYKYLALYQEHTEKLKPESQKKIAAEITLKYQMHKKDLENKTLKAEKEKQDIVFRHQQMKLIFGLGLLIIMLVLLVVLYTNRQHLKYTNLKLQEANVRMQIQNEEIKRQKEEISSQALILKSQNEQLEKDNVFKNKIFSIISHDLRSPFVSMSAFINLMQVRNLVSAETKPIFDLFGRDIDIITNMINNLLAWSKAQLTGDKLKMELTDLYFLAEENVDLTAARAQEKKIRVINEVPDDTIILTDKERLNIVIRNLLANAIKFTPHGGQVRLHVKEQPQTIILTVSDNGLGIPDKFLPKLFSDQRFTTLGTSKERGTGLGLMLSKELMNSLQGQIAVESQEGKGSSFSLILPKLVPETTLETRERKGICSVAG